MRLGVFDGRGGPTLGAVLGDRALDLGAAWPALWPHPPAPPPASVRDLLAAPGLLDRVRERLAAPLPPVLGSAWAPSATVRWRAPLPDPGKILCAASNYAAHIVESGREAPANRHLITPWLFLKPATTVIGPGDPIPVPRQGQAIDWEVELAVVIGRRARHVLPADALDYVGGYTLVNEISERRFRVPAGRPAREWDQFFDWLHGKWFDGFLPMGPWLVTADEIPDPQGLALELRVNGRLRQQGSTAQMIYPVAELIAFASSIMTLLPGDVIATGTPQGVGGATGEYLRPGDVVQCDLETVGTLVNPVAAEEGLPGR